MQSYRCLNAVHCDRLLSHYRAWTPADASRKGHLETELDHASPKLKERVLIQTTRMQRNNQILRCRSQSKKRSVGFMSSSLPALLIQTE